MEKPESSGWIKQDDGYYNNKPSDNNHFKKHYEERTQNSAMYATYAGSQLGKVQENKKVPDVLGVRSL